MQAARFRHGRGHGRKWQRTKSARKRQARRERRLLPRHSQRPGRQRVGDGHGRAPDERLGRCRQAHDARHRLLVRDPQADASLARRAFTQPADAQPDCDTAPVPLPPGGKVEGSGDYACRRRLPLLRVQGSRLYELYQANVTGGMATGGTFTGTCLVIWDLTKDYWEPAAPPNFSRGDHCNGADAGDMPMAPLLLTAEEIKSGKIKHALRFTISNNRIRKGVYVHPATHVGGPSGGSDTLPYG